MMEQLLLHRWKLLADKNVRTVRILFLLSQIWIESVKLLLVGGGPQESQLRDLLKKNNIQDRVIFTRRQSDVHRILSGVIYCTPSYTEGLSNCIWEAMACGKSIICSDIQAKMRKYFMPINQEAILVNPDEQKQIVKALWLLINDSSLRTRLGKKFHNQSLSI